MNSDSYKININGMEGILNVSKEPFCILGDIHYPISRRMMKNDSWGYIDFEYEIHCPDGGIVNGGVSPRDGIGVNVGAGQSWGIAPIGESASRQGDRTEIIIDRAARTIAVESTEASDRIPHILCGLVLLADPQERWEKDYS